MIESASIAAAPAFSPLDLRTSSLAVKAAAVLLGTAVLAVASQLSVPMLPVPMTMQTLAVILIGALYGWRLATITIFAWLLEAALGLPVLANGKAGLAPFVGPTAGYLISFPLVGALVGWLSERGWNGGLAARRTSWITRCPRTAGDRRRGGGGREAGGREGAEVERHSRL